MTDSKTIKADLKKAFPSTKFSIKTRKSLDTVFIISYTDGPTEKEVMQFLKSFDKISYGPCGDILSGDNTMTIIDRTVTK